MPDLSQFPITRRWKPTRPDVIQLYSLPTPNGVKVSIMLEETGLAYEPHLVDIMKDENKTAEFVSLNPNAKIVKGYQRDIMPVFEGQIGEEGLLQLIVYIKSLSPPAPLPAKSAAPAAQRSSQ